MDGAVLEDAGGDGSRGFGPVTTGEWRAVDVLFI